LGVVRRFLPNSKNGTQQPWNLLLGCKMLQSWVDVVMSAINHNYFANWGLIGLQIDYQCCFSYMLHNQQKSWRNKWEEVFRSWATGTPRRQGPHGK